MKPIHRVVVMCLCCFAWGVHGNDAAKPMTWPEGGKIEVSLEVRETEFAYPEDPKPVKDLIGYLTIKNTGEVTVPLEYHQKPSHLAFIYYDSKGKNDSGEDDGQHVPEVVPTLLEPGHTLKWRVRPLAWVNGQGQISLMEYELQDIGWLFALYRPLGKQGPEYVTPVTTVKKLGGN